VPVLPRDIVTRIKEESDIVSVVREYVSLKPAGTSFKGLCPFHREKTPSFHVNPHRQIFKCFGCGEGGDSISFLMKLQGLAFPEAIEVLARPLNIDLARYLTDNDESEGERQAYFRALEVASTLWQEEFWSDVGKEGREYLEKRGFAEEMLRRYEVGFARNSRSWLADELSTRGVDLDLAVRTDLMRSKDGGVPFAYFRNRIIFPVKNVAQRVAGFGGRVLGDDEPKYLNSAESPYYNKRQLLYGFSLSRIPIARHSMAILVEGYLDLMALAQAGYANSVATCGTAFTPEQARSLRRGCRTVFILFDGDKAGLKAAVKSAGLALTEGLEPRVARLPLGEDPASFLQQRDASAMAEILEAAPSYLPLLKTLADESELGREAQERAVKTALNTLSQVEDPIRRAYLAEECAEVFGLEKVIVSGELEKIADKHERRLYARKQTDSPVQEDLSDVPMPESLFGVDTWTVLKQAYVHVLQDDTGAAALAYLSLDFPSGGVPEWGIALRDDLRDWDEEHDRGNPPTPAAFVQARWYDRDDAYRRGVAELLNIQEGALVADHVRIVRDCHQRLEMVRNRRNDVEALRAHGRGQGE
jgi:DNA primase